jgi:hypothetical protein
VLALARLFRARKAKSRREATAGMGTAAATATDTAVITDTPVTAAMAGTAATAAATVVAEMEAAGISGPPRVARKTRARPSPLVGEGGSALRQQE